jgi:hypothetical protein
MKYPIGDEYVMAALASASDGELFRCVAFSWWLGVFVFGWPSTTRW